MLERRPTEVRVHTHAQRFPVEYDYPVVFTRDAFDPDNPTFADIVGRRDSDKRHRLAVFVDDGVLAAAPWLDSALRAYASTHADIIEVVGALAPVPGGEFAKNDPSVLGSVLQGLAERAIDRHSYAVAIGGGAVLDVIGFAATIFHRGVRHIRFPTTVLSQDDSGVGVKNAVNAFGVKNLLGAFAPPFAVINDGAFIDCLPDRQKRGGMAEAVKVALIRDRSFFDWIEDNVASLARFDPAPLDHLIERSATLHMSQIAKGGDPFETGSSRPLDFGHWAAHKLEMLTRHALSHGEAVAIGMALDARYSVLSGLLSESDCKRVCDVLEALGFALWHDALALRGADGELEVLTGLREFQEHLGGELTITLLSGIGTGVDVHAVRRDLVQSAATWLCEREV